MTVTTDKETQSGSRETLYTMALRREEKDPYVRYAKKTPSKITKEDMELIERFYEQINRDYYKSPIPSCCKTYMEACFNSENKGWYCKKCFVWIKDSDRYMHEF